MSAADISGKFAHNFTEESRMEGEKLFAQARCLQRWAGSDRVCCECADDDQHSISCSLQLNGRTLQAQCECADFQQKRLCAHLWAALLSAQEHGDLSLALKRSVSKNIGSPRQADDEPGSTHAEPQYHFDAPRRRQRAPAPQSKGSGDERRVVYEPSSAALSSPSTRPHFVLNEDAPIDILYVIRLERQPLDGRGLVVETWWRPRKDHKQQAQPARPFVPEGETAVPSVGDRDLLRLLWVSKSDSGSIVRADELMLPPQGFYLPGALLERALPMLVASGRARWLSNEEKPPRLHAIVPSQATHAFPMPFRLHIQPNNLGFFTFTGAIQLSDVSLPLGDCQLVLSAGYALCRNEFVAVDFLAAADFALELHRRGRITLNDYAARAKIQQLALSSDLDLNDLPEALQHQFIKLNPTPQLYVRTAQFTYLGREQLHAELTFDYGGARCDEQNPHPRLAGPQPGTTIVRDQEAEELAHERLKQLGLRWNRNAAKEELGWKLSPAALDDCVHALIMEDWLVQAEGKTYRKPMPKTPQLSSGMDWFDLQADISFGEQLASLPALLKAKRAGKNAVRLDDGTYGILPLEWLEQFTVLTELGEVLSDKLRFRQEQAAIIAVLLQDRQAEADERFRQQLAAMNAADEEEPVLPASFQATLRPYQLDGLRWLLHMQRHGLGACLADDMGLGKTVQVLALLEHRRCRAELRRPSLVVMPKSLIFNWQAEAARFAPQLRIVIHTGSARQCRPQAFAQADLVFTTYGTLRNDASKLAKIHFDYCILDESQAIKNRDSATARAACVIKAEHRLVMTGTPIENHLGELFSQLDFLNPGLLGSKLPSSNASSAANLSAETMQRLQQGVRPFILRRSKQQVAKELPPKSEQIIFCEMNEQQQREYDELKNFYRQSLLPQEANTAKPSHAQHKSAPGNLDALTALLRLRQAACHPALLDATRSGEGSAKLDLIEERLLSLVDAGHKSLVFSQFTSLLRIVQRRLLSHGIDFCYLDGQTKNRAELVNCFQADPAKRVFLISLKAGGVGLNLTAADYVFLLDPWWNPAVENQAIDRAYRIGQTLPVFAYRVITRDSVEEKVLRLQEQKRRLANAVLGKEEAAAIEKRLSSEDLRFLLS
jgi:superfamily II DNA or RNA helicase